MSLSLPTLSGRHVRLEPLQLQHVDALLAAAESDDPELYCWTSVPQDRAAMTTYIEKALAMREAGSAIPFATRRVSDGKIVGCTRFFDLERWDWPAGHARHAVGRPDVGEIGYTWLSPVALRTGVNTEAKLLMLGHGFETLGMQRICLQTHSRNARSRAAIERIGGRFEGIIRASKLAPDHTPRDSARFSILATEWPGVKENLNRMLRRA
ncbi:MAG TPA: GNAT family protein [Gammaproteobacteria bacterium]|jgi:RimJ/RimL family protein N-acetyltransferase